MIKVYSVEKVYRAHYLKEEDEAAVKAHMEATGDDILTAVQAVDADLWYETEECDWEPYEPFSAEVIEDDEDDEEENHD